MYNARLIVCSVISIGRVPIVIVKVYCMAMRHQLINGYAVLQKMCTTVYGGLFSWARFLPKDRVSVVPKQFSDVLDGNFVDDCV